MNRTYQSWLDLGIEFTESHSHLTRALTLICNMFPRNLPATRRLEKVYRELGAIRSELDSTFCREIPEDQIPQGMPKFPMYCFSFLRDEKDDDMGQSGICQS